MNAAEPVHTLPSTVPTLSARLREGTREAHRAAERGRFVRNLLRGDVTHATYARYLAALHRLYAGLEAGLAEHREHPCVAPLVWPALWRTAAVAADLQALLGPAWAEHVSQDRLADLYVDRLAALTAEDPPLLVAHAYTRYLGDLSGGQLLGGAVARFAPDAVALYAFPGLDVTAARHGFRARLDALPLGPLAEAAVVAEAGRAFTLLTGLMAGL